MKQFPPGKTRKIKAPEAKSSKRRTARKDLIPKFEVVEGDCIETLSQYPANKVQLVIADPPFGIGWKGYKKCKDNAKGSTYSLWSNDWLEQVRRVLTSHGSLWVYIGEDHVSEVDMAAKNMGFHKRGHITHFFPFGEACARNFSKCTHFFLYYTMHKTIFRFHDMDIRVPSARQLVYNDKRANPDGKLPDNFWVLLPKDIKQLTENGGNAWFENRIAGTHRKRIQRSPHGKKRVIPQMPLELPDRIIKACTDPGDLVIDPFLGTGTTGVAAVMNQCHFWGCDDSIDEVLNSEYRIKKALPTK